MAKMLGHLDLAPRQFLAESTTFASNAIRPVRTGFGSSPASDEAISQEPVRLAMRAAGSRTASKWPATWKVAGPVNTSAFIRLDPEGLVSFEQTGPLFFSLQVVIEDLRC